MAIWKRNSPAVVADETSSSTPSAIATGNEKGMYEADAYATGETATGVMEPVGSPDVDNLHRGLKARHITMIGMYGNLEDRIVGAVILFF